jgi:hypothetical protein
MSRLLLSHRSRHATASGCYGAALHLTPLPFLLLLLLLLLLLNLDPGQTKGQG